jgi:hypothetical protein
MKHRWPKLPTIISPNKSERECQNGCGIVKVSRHEYPAGSVHGTHWQEFWRGLDRVDVDGRTPVCEAIKETV